MLNYSRILNKKRNLDFKEKHTFFIATPTKHECLHGTKLIDSQQNEHELIDEFT